MSRPLRLEFPGALFHVTARGNARQDIFFDDVDRCFFLDALGAAVKRFAWILPSYVLMSNHFHLVIQLTHETLSRGMQWLEGKYVAHFNRRHRRIGHLFQGRFHAPLVEKETYALEVLRYDALNPVRAAMVWRPEDYVWSSHRAVLGLVAAPDWLTTDDALVQFAPHLELARANYKSFVNGAIGCDQNPWKDLVAQTFLGSQSWIDRVRERIELKPRSDDHPSSQRLVAAPSMAAVIAGVADTFHIDQDRIRHGRGGIPRMMAAWIAWNDGQLTNRDIAAGLRLRSSGNVSRIVQLFEHELKKQPLLQEGVDRCVSTIRRKKAESKL